MTRQVYALSASDEPLQVRYVGATVQSLEIRLRGHWHEERRRTGRKDHRKSAWMACVRARGATVEIRSLGQYETDQSLYDAEATWRRFWSGYCDLLNLDFIRWSAGKRKVARYR